MKRALTAAVVGGLLAFAVPQAALADSVGYELADHGHNEATGPEGSPEPNQGPPPSQPYGDREQHDDEEGTILF